MHPECSQDAAQEPAQPNKRQEPAKTQPIKRAQPQEEEDDLDLEDHYHDESTFCAVSVIMHEINVCKELAKKHPYNSSYYTDKADNLEFEKSTLESNVGTGIVTPDKYIKNLKNFLANTTALHKEACQKLGSKNTHTKRLQERIQLIQVELKDMSDGAAQQVEESKQEPPQKTKQKMPQPVQ